MLVGNRGDWGCCSCCISNNGCLCINLPDLEVLLGLSCDLAHCMHADADQAAIMDDYAGGPAMQGDTLFCMLIPFLWQQQLTGGSLGDLVRTCSVAV